MAPGQMPIKYQCVDRPLVHEIFTSHILKGLPLLKHILDGPVERIARHELLFCRSARSGWIGRKLIQGPLAERLKAGGWGS